MGKITFTVEGSTVGSVKEGRGVVVDYEVSEQDSAKLVEAMAHFHQGSLSQLERQPTIEDIVKVWFNDCVKTALRLTEEHELRKMKPAKISVTGFE